jgi:dihydrofolate synthase/folylpolyglutamate synthase
MSKVADKIESNIQTHAKFGSVLGLERMRVLMDTLCNPQDGLNVIHVAGTNGKGSVCRYIYEVLLAHGYSCGLFISPFITVFNERIQLNGEYISDDDLEKYSGAALAVSNLMKQKGEAPTEFEIITAIALLYFAEKKPDFVILEVGLGGSGDSTNIIDKPLVSVITQIAMDHTDRLGDTIELIAAEKAGIIKCGCPVVTVTDGEAAKVIARRAYELDSPFFSAVNSVKDAKVYGNVINAKIRGLYYSGIEISMLGWHQIENAICALTALEILREDKYIRMNSEVLKAGMLKARMPGRFEIVNDNPIVVLDGAHNAAGAAALNDTVAETFPDKKVLALLGILADKDAEAVLQSVCEFTDGLILTTAPTDRGMPAAELRELAGAFNDTRSGDKIFIESVDAPSDALVMARQLADEGNYDVIIICGSLFLIAVLRSELVRE